MQVAVSSRTSTRARVPPASPCAARAAVRNASCSTAIAPDALACLSAVASGVLYFRRASRWLQAEAADAGALVFARRAVGAGAFAGFEFAGVDSGRGRHDRRGRGRRRTRRCTPTAGETPARDTGGTWSADRTSRPGVAAATPGAGPSSPTGRRGGVGNTSAAPCAHLDRGTCVAPDPWCIGSGVRSTCAEPVVRWTGGPRRLSRRPGWHRTPRPGLARHTPCRQRPSSR